MTTQLQSLSQNINNMDYLKCPKGDLHCGQNLNKICVDTKCTQKELICAICQQQSHKQHQTIHIKKFMDVLIGDNTYFDHILENIKIIDKCRSQVERQLALKKREILQEFQRLENSSTKYFDQVSQLTRSLLHCEGPVKKLIQDMVYGKQQNVNALKVRIQQIFSILNMKIDENFSIKQHFDLIIENVKQKHKETISSLTNLVYSFKKKVQSSSRFLESSFCFPQFHNYTWSNLLKGAKIKINKSIAQQTGMESSGQRFILMDKDLNTNSSRKSWGIKINKLGGWIGIGISLKNKIILANYNFNYNNIGHGSYLISTNGYAWSHSQKQFNSAFKCFTFAIGDIIYIQYNPLTNKIKFRKNNSQQKKDNFELSVAIPPVGDSYHPSANLCSNNDTVQIVQCLISLS